MCAFFFRSIQCFFSFDLNFCLIGRKIEKEIEKERGTKRVVRMQFSVTKAKVQKVDGTNEIVTINNRNENQVTVRDRQRARERIENGKKPYEIR